MTKLTNDIGAGMFVILSLALLQTSIGHSSPNIEATLKKYSQKTFAADADVSLMQTSDVSFFKSYKIDLTFQMMTKHESRLDRFGDRFIFAYAREESERSSNVVADTEYFHGRYTHVLTPLLGFDVFAERFANKFLNIDSREFYGAGIRLDFSGDNYLLVTGLGGFYEEEIYVSSTSSSRFLNRAQAYIGFSSSLYESLNLAAIIYWRPSVSKIRSNRVYSGYDLSVPVGEHFKTGLKGSLRLESDPAQGVPDQISTISQYVRLSF